jgi:acyl-CoA thioester hydrolase
MTKAIVACEVEIEVPFFDVDLMEIVWHGNYLKYFEVARCVLLDKIDYNYMQMRESGYTWPVIDVRIRYAKPAKFGQKLLVYVDISEWENRLKMNYKIVDKLTGTRLTRGPTYQVAVDIPSGEMCYESPAIIWEKLGLTKPTSNKPSA